MFTINCKGRLLILDEPKVMGIINTTPDSFYSGSRIHQTGEVLFRVEKMLEEGAAILDIGGQSTRPGSVLINEEDELQRVLPAIEAIMKRFPDSILSIDTFYGKVAKYAVEAGASIINDISAGSMDPSLLSTVAALQVPYVLMHMKGTPQTMQKNAVYNNVVTEVFDTLNRQVHYLHQTGIKDIIIDLGFGFSKTRTHNLQLLENLSYFSHLDAPLLAGLSRKATIYKTLGVTSNEALNGTTVLNTIALLNGAHILRVHDVKEAVEAITLVQLYKNKKEELV